MLTLYHLAISHYSEKARWALEHKGVEYRSRLLTPGYHILTVRRVAGTSTVPVLRDSETGAVVSDSTDILHFLDRLRPEPGLFPRDEEEGARVSEIEEFFDEHCATHVARFAYHHVLDFPQVLATNWTLGLSWPRRALMRASIPVLRRAMRRARGINAETARYHREQVMVALDRLSGWLAESGSGYLVGQGFTAADLTAAALLGPAIRPEGSPWEALRRDGGDLPEGFPPAEYAEFLDQVAAHDAADWVRGIWRRHRHPKLEQPHPPE